MIIGEQLFNKGMVIIYISIVHHETKAKINMKHDKDRAMWVDKKKNGLWLDILFDDNVKS